MKRSHLCFSIFLFLLVIAGIPIAAASPTVTSIVPATGPNDVALTVDITGTGFNSGSIVTLTKCGTGSGTITGTISSVSATKITATFDLTGQAAGKWTVRVNTPYGEYPVDQGSLFSGFEVYKASGSSTPVTTTTTTMPTTTVTTTTTSAEGENSVFFETSPTGATIYLDGNEIGISTFTYYTNREGTYDVVVKKIGYEDYEAKVVIIERKQVHFYAPLSLRSTTPSTTVTTKTSATPGKTTTATTMTTTTAISTTNNALYPAINSSTATKTPTKTLPTPWGTDFPATTEKSSSDPATVLWAAILGIAFVVMRRR